MATRTKATRTQATRTIGNSYKGNSYTGNSYTGNSYNRQLVQLATRIYTYSIDGDKKSKKVPNAKAQEILARYKLSPSEGASSVENQQIRVVSRFVNEALICLEEGIISSPSDGDVASIVFGLGFPPFWGGPFRFVDLYGAQKLIKHMERYGNIYSAVQFASC
ncbi:hypothetical protein niasHT_038896 [Heterodera trifolii]|uniref:Uncharacterized protein n=1 Tax=Heterodera trifolii TaxID=157864 RepID=A0ABD2IK04_9BILA